MKDPRLLRAALVCLLAAFPTPVPAQSSTERLALDRFRDSLAARRDVPALESLYRTRERGAGSAAGELRKAYLALRLAELDADPGARRAIERFRGATRRWPDSAEGWYGLARAEALRAAWEQRDRLALGSRVGLGTLERAAGRYRRALEADPAFAPAALDLADLTLSLRDTALVAETRDAVRDAVAASPAPGAGLLLAWGRLERAAGETDSALAAFDRAVAAGGGAVARLERARTGLAADRVGAEWEYYAAAAEDDSAAQAGYRADLAFLATEVELARFDALRPAERAGYLRRFWGDRDRAELRATGERLREHYRRLLHARRSYALTVSRRFYGDADAYRSGSGELDDRGVIYLRHGEPARRLQPFVFGLMPNESWRYARADGDLLFHFSAGYDDRGGGDLYDYRLVESVLDLRGAGDAPPDQLLLSRQPLSGMYGRMLNWGPFGAARVRARERSVGQASIAIGTRTDSYELQYARPLPALASLVAVGSRGRLGLTHLVFAIPAEALRAGEPLRVRVVALDPAGRPAAWADTTLAVGSPDSEGERGRYLVGRVELPLEAGVWTWRAAVQQGDSAGSVLPRDSVRVARPGRGVALSDLALGLRSASVAWEPVPGDTVLLTPFDLFRTGSEVELYYEAAGVAPGTYRHEIAVYRVRGDPPLLGRRPVVSLAVDEPVSGTLLRSHRRLQLERVRPGRYLVEVRLAGPGGAAATRSRAFTVTRARGR